MSVLIVEFAAKGGFVVLFILLHFVFSDVCENKCHKPASLCDFDFECLSKLRSEDCVGECKRSLYYSDLYEGREEAPFRLTSRSYDLYANAKFAVYSTKSRKPVGDCCNLTLNQTCKLRSMDKGDHFELIGRDEEDEYCYLRVQKHRKIKWCTETKGEPDCLELKNGEITLKQKWKDANTFDYVRQKRADHCLFEAKVEVAKKGDLWKDGWVRNVAGITLNEDRWGDCEPGSVEKMGVNFTNDVSTECYVNKDVSNLTLYTQNYTAKPGHNLCSFACAGNTWSAAKCYFPSEKTKNTHYIALLAILPVGICLILLVGSNFCWKKIKYCYPAYTEIEKEIPKELLDPVERGTLLSVDVKEIPDEIIPDGAKNGREYLIGGLSHSFEISFTGKRHSSSSDSTSQSSSYLKYKDADSESYHDVFVVEEKLDPITNSTFQPPYIVKAQIPPVTNRNIVDLEAVARPWVVGHFDAYIGKTSV